MRTYPFIEAKWKTVTNGRHPTLIVLHCPISAERPDSAESVARYFQTTDRKASTHLISDNNSTVRCVLDKDVAYGAANANRVGLHIEIAGRADQTPAEWIDDYSLAAMEQAAMAVADWQHDYAIPNRFLLAADLRAGIWTGITAHSEVEKAFPSTGHTDPGLGFPVSHFLARCRYHYAPSSPTPPHGPIDPLEDDVSTYLPHAYEIPNKGGWMLFYPLTGEVRIFPNGPSFDRMRAEGHIGTVHEKPLTQDEYNGWLAISGQG